MSRNKILGIAAVMAVAVALLGWLAYRHWHVGDGLLDREAMLSLMPEDASAVIYLDVAQLRSSPLFAQLSRWAPEPTVDSDYAQFLQATGFNYESDLDRAALAIERQPQSSLAFAVVEGRFDRKKIEAFAGKYGSLKTADGKTLFAVPLSGSNRKAYFTFLGGAPHRVGERFVVLFRATAERHDGSMAGTFFATGGHADLRGVAAGFGGGGGIVIAGSGWIAFTAIGGAPGATGVDFDQRETGRQFTARGNGRRLPDGDDGAPVERGIERTGGAGADGIERSEDPEASRSGIARRVSGVVAVG